MSVLSIMNNNRISLENKQSNTESNHSIYQRNDRHFDSLRQQLCMKIKKFDYKIYFYDQFTKYLENFKEENTPRYTKFNRARPETVGEYVDYIFSDWQNLKRKLVENRQIAQGIII